MRKSDYWDIREQEYKAETKLSFLQKYVKGASCKWVHDNIHSVLLGNWIQMLVGKPNWPNWRNDANLTAMENVNVYHAIH